MLASSAANKRQPHRGGFQSAYSSIQQGSESYLSNKPISGITFVAHGLFDVLSSPVSESQRSWRPRYGAIAISCRVQTIQSLRDSTGRPRGMHNVDALHCKHLDVLKFSFVPSTEPSSAGLSPESSPSVVSPSLHPRLRTEKSSFPGP